MASILVTGAAGFIGSHLCDYLLKEGHEVCGLDNLSTGVMKNIHHLENHTRFTFIKDTVTDFHKVQELVAGRDTIYHLAAAVGVEKILESPLESIGVNLIGTENVLKAAAHERCKVFIASSSEVYGKTFGLLREEDDRIYGSTLIKRWHYAGTKAVDEFMALAYYQERSLPLVVARFFNTTGPRQTGKYGMVAPRFVSQALKGEPITVFGDGTQRRSFTDVRDAVRAMVALMNTEKAEGQLFNIGSGFIISINTLAQTIKEMTDSSSPIIHLSYEEAYGQGFEDMEERIPDITKIRRVISFEPLWNLEKTLSSMISYEQKNGL